MGQAITWFLALCAGISCVGAAVGWVMKAWRAASAPNRKQDARLDQLEAAVQTLCTRLDRHDMLFGNDKTRLDAIEEGSHVTQRAILALLAHGIDGNAVDAMRSAKEELQEYLIRR